VHERRVCDDADRMSEFLAEVEQAVARACPPRSYPAPGPGFGDATLTAFSWQIVAAHAADQRIVDAEHRGAWDLLLRDVQRLVGELRSLIDIRLVPYERYSGPEDMRVDVVNHRRLEVSTLHCVHPLWTPEQNCEFRVAHDILGHVLRPHPFSLAGEYLASHDHMRHTDPAARQAVFTEVCMYASIRYTVGEYPEVQRAIAMPQFLARYEREFLAEPVSRA